MTSSVTPAPAIGPMVLAAVVVVAALIAIYIFLNLDRSDDVYNAAVAGNIKVLRKHVKYLEGLVTPVKNHTVLHLSIVAQTAETENPDFVAGILELSLSLLHKANAAGDTPLQLASRLGLSRVAEVLILRDPYSSFSFSYSANKVGETPLYLLSKKSGNVAILRLMLESSLSSSSSSPQLLYSGPNGRTALHAVLSARTLKW